MAESFVGISKLILGLETFDFDLPNIQNVVFVDPSPATIIPNFDPTKLLNIILERCHKAFWEQLVFDISKSKRTGNVRNDARRHIFGINI